MQTTALEALKVLMLEGEFVNCPFNLLHLLGILLKCEPDAGVMYSRVALNLNFDPWCLERSSAAGTVRVLTVLLGKLLRLLVRDVPLRLQVGFVPYEDDHLRAHRPDGGETRQPRAGGSAACRSGCRSRLFPNRLLHKTVDGDRDGGGRFPEWPR